MLQSQPPPLIHVSYLHSCDEVKGREASTMSQDIPLNLTCQRRFSREVGEAGCGRGQDSKALPTDLQKWVQYRPIFIPPNSDELANFYHSQQVYRAMEFGFATEKLRSFQTIIPDSKAILDWASLHYYQPYWHIFNAMLRGRVDNHLEARKDNGILGRQVDPAEIHGQENDVSLLSPKSEISHASVGERSELDECKSSEINGEIKCKDVEYLLPHINENNGDSSPAIPSPETTPNSASSGLGVEMGSSRFPFEIKAKQALGKPKSKSTRSSSGASFECVQCDATYSHRFELNRHIKVSHVRPHRCEHCGKGFGHKNYLRVHIETVHMGRKTHRCGLCGKYLSTGGNLSVHVRTIHMGEKKYSCPVCSRTFGQQCNMKTHMRRHYVRPNVMTSAS